MQVLYWGSHEVARELEDPFHIWSTTTYNCLPFSSIQWGFNEDILAFAYSVVRPCRHPAMVASTCMPLLEWQMRKRQLHL
jgi:hypothetical protein